MLPTICWVISGSARWLGDRTAGHPFHLVKALVPLVHTFPHAGTLAEILFAVGIVALGLEVFVSKSRDELHREYRDLPPRSTVVEENIDLDTGEDDSRAITSEPSATSTSPLPQPIYDDNRMRVFRTRNWMTWSSSRQRPPKCASLDTTGEVTWGQMSRSGYPSAPSQRFVGAPPGTPPQAWVTPPQAWVTPPQAWVTPPQAWVTPPQAWVTPPSEQCHAL